MQYSPNDPRNISCCNGRPSAERGAALAVERHALRPFAEILLAQDRRVAVAIEAMPAMRVPRQHDMVADLNAARGGADLLDDAGGLVPEHDRHRIAQRSLDHFEIGVAEPGGADPHQHVGRLQRRRRDRFDRHRRLRAHAAPRRDIAAAIRRPPCRKARPAPHRDRPRSSPIHYRNSPRRPA